MIPDRARQLSTREGFLSAVQVWIADGATGSYAYKKVEEEYFSYFNRYRYSSYNSFYQTNYKNKKPVKINENKTT